MKKFAINLLPVTFLIACSGIKNNTSENTFGAPVRICDVEENGWCLLKGRYEILNINRNENIKTWYLRIDSEGDGDPIVKLIEPKSCQQQISNQVEELSRNMKIDDEDGSWNVMKVSFSEDGNCNIQFFTPTSSQSLAINNFFQVNIGICEKDDSNNRICNRKVLADLVKRIDADGTDF